MRRGYKRVILAIDGMQPDVGHEVLWVIRECLSGEILLARTLLSARSEDLAVLLSEVKEALVVPIAGVVSDGQQSIRKAVETALPGVAHGLCHFHYLREAAKLIFEADRHAKKELKKQVRGVRSIERSVAGCDDLTFPVKSGQAANLHRGLGVSTSRAKGLGYQSEFDDDVPDNLRARATASTAQATVSILGNLEDLVLALRTAI